MICTSKGFPAPPARQASDSECLAVQGGDDLPLAAWCRRRAATVERTALAVAAIGALAFALPFLLLLAR